MSYNKPSTRPNAAQDLQRAVLPAVDVFEDASGTTLLADMPQRSQRSTGTESGGRRPVDRGRRATAHARRPRSYLCRGARAALPPQLCAEPRAGQYPHWSQPEGRCAEPAHPQAGARAAAQDRGDGRLNMGTRPDAALQKALRQVVGS